MPVSSGDQDAASDYRRGRCRAEAVNLLVSTSAFTVAEIAAGVRRITGGTPRAWLDRGHAVRPPNSGTGQVRQLPGEPNSELMLFRAERGATVPFSLPRRRHDGAADRPACADGSLHGNRSSDSLFSDIVRRQSPAFTGWLETIAADLSQPAEAGRVIGPGRAIFTAGVARRASSTREGYASISTGSRVAGSDPRGGDA